MVATIEPNNAKSKKSAAQTGFVANVNVVTIEHEEEEAPALSKGPSSKKNSPPRH